jgi:hypothetical protein
VRCAARRPGGLRTRGTPVCVIGIGDGRGVWPLPRVRQPATADQLPGAPIRMICLVRFALHHTVGASVPADVFAPTTAMTASTGSSRSGTTEACPAAPIAYPRSFPTCTGPAPSRSASRTCDGRWPGAARGCRGAGRGSRRPPALPGSTSVRRSASNGRALPVELGGGVITADEHLVSLAGDRGVRCGAGRTPGAGWARARAAATAAGPVRRRRAPGPAAWTRRRRTTPSRWPSSSHGCG